MILIIFIIISVSSFFTEIDIPGMNIDFFNLASPASGILLIASKYKSIKNFLFKYRWELMLILLMIILMFLSSFFSFDKATALKYSVKYLELFILMIGLMIYFDTMKNKEIIIKFFFSVSIILAVFGILIYIFPQFFMEFLFEHKIGLLLLPRNESLFSNPNVYGVFSAIILSMAVMSLMQRKISKYFACITIVSSLFGVISSGSKNGLLTLLMSFIFICFIYLKKYRKKLLAFIVVIILIPAAIWYVDGVNYYFTSKEMNIKNEITNIFYGSISPRLDLYKGAFFSFVENPIIGSGPHVFNNHIDKYASVNGYDTNNIVGVFNTHNLFLQILVEMGIFGFILLSSLFFLIYKLYKKKKPYFSLTLLLILLGQIFDCFTYDYFFMVFFITILSICICENSFEDNNAGKIGKS